MQNAPFANNLHEVSSQQFSGNVLKKVTFSIHVTLIFGLLVKFIFDNKQISKTPVELL